MRYLNVACGGIRPTQPWVNQDCLHSQFPTGTPERTHLDRESNYVDHVLGADPLPFPDDSFDGCLLSHCIEHWNCGDAVRILRDCRRVLKPGAPIVASVPDASYFRKVATEDTRENAERLFGEPIHNASKDTFRSYALFFHQHVQILNEDGLWAILMESGFNSIRRVASEDTFTNDLQALMKVVNRSKFSVIMAATK